MSVHSTTRWNTGATGVRPAAKQPAPSRTYRWRGETFISQSDVAAEAGVTVRAVQMHLTKNGHLDNLGNGRNSDTSAAAAARSKSLEVLGFEFVSVRAFAAKVGKPFSTVQRWVQNEQTDRLEAALIAAARRGEAE